MNHHIRRSMLSVKVLLFLCIDFSSSWLELAFPSGTQLPSDTAYSSALAGSLSPPSLPPSLPPAGCQHFPQSRHTRWTDPLLTTILYRTGQGGTASPIDAGKQSIIRQIKYEKYNRYNWDISGGKLLILLAISILDIYSCSSALLYII